MAVPGSPDPNWFQMPAWWQVIIAVVGGALAGFFAGASRVMSLVSRVDVLEANARNDREAALEHRGKVDDAISALAESHRAATAKIQDQIWDVREKVAQLGQIPSMIAQILQMMHERRD